MHPNVESSFQTSINVDLKPKPKEFTSQASSNCSQRAMRWSKSSMSGCCSWDQPWSAMERRRCSCNFDPIDGWWMYKHIKYMIYVCICINTTFLHRFGARAPGPQWQVKLQFPLVKLSLAPGGVEATGRWWCETPWAHGCLNKSSKGRLKMIELGDLKGRSHELRWHSQSWMHSAYENCQVWSTGPKGSSFAFRKFLAKKMKWWFWFTDFYAHIYTY